MTIEPWPWTVRGYYCGRCGQWVGTSVHYCTGPAPLPLPTTYQLQFVRDHSAEIDALRARVDELERRLAALKPEPAIDHWEDPVL